MKKSHSIPRLQTDNQIPPKKAVRITCDACGEKFQKPVFAVVASSYGLSEGYYACPRCLSKTKANYEEMVKQKSNKISSKIPSTPTIEDSILIEQTVESPNVDSANQEELPQQKAEDGLKPADCKHELGYLKKRPKNTPIPDECFTCSEMINCTH